MEEKEKYWERKKERKKERILGEKERKVRKTGWNEERSENK